MGEENVLKSVGNQSSCSVYISPRKMSFFHPRSPRIAPFNNTPTSERRKKISRSLFGTPEPGQTEKWIEERLSDCQMKQSEKWAFDFRTETPVKGGRWDWSFGSVSGQPEFYSPKVAKQFVSPQSARIPHSLSPDAPSSARNEELPSADSETTGEPSGYSSQQSTTAISSTSLESSSKSLGQSAPSRKRPWPCSTPVRHTVSQTLKKRGRIVSIKDCFRTRKRLLSGSAKKESKPGDCSVKRSQSVGHTASSVPSAVKSIRLNFAVGGKTKGEKLMNAGAAGVVCICPVVLCLCTHNNHQLTQLTIVGKRVPASGPLS